MELLTDVLKRSRAETTSYKYGNAFLRWKKWGISNDLGSSEILPAKALTVAIYLVSLIQTARTPSPIVSAFYGIKWMHEMYGLESPTNNKMVLNVLEAAKRMLSRPIVKKEPITVDVLLALYQRLYKDNNLKSQRIISACILAFAGFLRSAELLQLRVCDLVFEETHVSVFIESSKTDQYRDGS